MSVTVKAGWLKDKQGNKLAPKTYFSQVQADDGTTLEQALEAAASSGSSVQPDWNVSDPEAPGYIKNRPFYEEFGEAEVILEEQTITCSAMGNAYGTMIQLSESYIMEPDKTYKFVLDGVEYISNSVLFDDYYPAIGNVGLTGMGADTGEPYVIMDYQGMLAMAFSNTEQQTHTIALYSIAVTVHKVPNRFLPVMAGKNVEGVEMADDDGNVYVGKYGAEIFNNDGNIASGESSHAEGSATKALGDYSHSEGDSTIASNWAAHAEGTSTIASGQFAHAEGDHATASGNMSHAEGRNTIASGSIAHAEGNETVASGYAAHSEGEGTIAASNRQHVQGKYNIEDTTGQIAHIVGNGNFTYENGEKVITRSNAHTLDWSGNAWYAGTIKIGGTSYDDASEIALKSDLEGLGGADIDVDSLELITVDDIDRICGTTIQMASEVTF